MKLDLVIDGVARPWRPGDDVISALHAFVDDVGPTDGELQVVVSDDRTLREHNRDFRGKDEPTDVLSFSYLEGHESARHELLNGGPAAAYRAGDADGLLGQVLISIDTVRARGRRHAADEHGEVLFLVTHGLLHVLGFDHVDDADAAEMEEVERRLFARLCARLGGGSS